MSQFTFFRELGDRFRDRGAPTQAVPEQLLANATAALTCAQQNLDAYLASIEAVRSGAKHAQSLEDAKTAALCRRRALQAHRPDEERGALLARAEWFDRRVAVQREGRIMPRDLRTPSETLRLVDELRHALLEVSKLISHLFVADVLTFHQAMKKAEGICTVPAAEAISAAREQLLSATGVMLGMLGGRQVPAKIDTAL
jgi:hypothetical protein